MTLEPDTSSELSSLDRRFSAIRILHRADEDAILAALMAEASVSAVERRAIQQRAEESIDAIRAAGRPSLMESLLAEYSLSTNEGVALMCLAETLLRVPDPKTANKLIEDKILPHQWSDRFNQSDSPLVNVATMALMLAKQVLNEGNSSSIVNLLRRTVKSLSRPVVRVAATRAMQAMGDRFVLGQSIEAAIARGKHFTQKGYLFSYDVLGEAALTAKDAAKYLQSYHNAIAAIGKTNSAPNIAEAPGISVKLSALHPRFELTKQARLLDELVPRLTALALTAQRYGMGLNVDAEEADRLEIGLKVVEAVLRDDRLSGWDGFGLVVQAYGKRAPAVIDWFYGLASALDRRVMLRLVKGAYWDTEIKRAQIDGVDDFSVFTRRAATDVSFICCGKKLLGMTDRIYPQFATHNAHTAAAILELAEHGQGFEFQRLHGMGETLHSRLLEREGVRCRIYAPVGPHRDLLPYLVRRLLENGANSSFVNQIVNHQISTKKIAADPFQRLQNKSALPPQGLKKPRNLFSPERKDSRGWDIHNTDDLCEIKRLRAEFKHTVWKVEPIAATPWEGNAAHLLYNPSDPQEVVGEVIFANEMDARRAIEAARPWQEDGATRAEVLRRAADRFEDSSGEIFALMAKEAGKTISDAIAELREAVDFLRYYANCAEELAPSTSPRGTISCISPWNFPLAIFTGQIAAALAAGNAVLAKPAEATPLIASLAVRLMHAAGVPRETLQYLPGTGITVGRALASHPRIGGVCFTGSVQTARSIYQNLAAYTAPWTLLIAETGGLNAAVIDSTALPERAVRHTIASAFQSAGQRCSALRLLCVQEDIADRFLEMLYGALDELALGNAWELEVDIGPVISERAQKGISAYIEAARKAGRVLKELQVPPTRGWFVPPTVITIERPEDLQREIFGPVLHVLRFAADDYDTVINAVNRSGYGLTFGLHTRIDARIAEAANRLKVGNLYVNRNQIGAIVGSQPFGGEGLSGTGPKAGGSHYVRRFLNPTPVRNDLLQNAAAPDFEIVQSALDHLQKPQLQRLSSELLPGPTGERNELSVWPRGIVLCLGPQLADALEQARAVRRAGSVPAIVAPGASGPGTVDGTLQRSHLEDLKGFDVVVLWSDEVDCRAARIALSQRQGPVVPLVVTRNIDDYCVVERHVCIDTTAAGGNVSLLGETES